MAVLHTDWSKERLIEVWFEDMVEACEKAGIPIPDLNSEPLTLHTVTSSLSHESA